VIIAIRNISQNEPRHGFVVAHAEPTHGRIDRCKMTKKTIIYTLLIICIIIALVGFVVVVAMRGGDTDASTPRFIWLMVTAFASGTAAYLIDITR